MARSAAQGSSRSNKPVRRKKQTSLNSRVPRLHESSSRLKELLHGMSDRRVLVVGDVGIDRYTYGDVERISPEAPVPIVWVKSEQLKLGLAANVADNVHALGGKCELLGIVGDDRFAQDFRALLKNIGVSPRSLIVDGSRRTIVKERVLSERQQLLRIDYESPHSVGAAIEKRILSSVKDLLKKADILVLQDYAKGMLSESLVGEIVAAATSAGKMIAVDPNAKSPLSLYEGASFLTPNKKEAEKLSGIEITDPASLRKAGRKILNATGAEHVVITLGKEGMAIFSHGQEEASLIPTFAREVYDVSGAGDTVITIMSLAMAAGATIEEAAVLGNLGAGVVVAKLGTATVTQKEILASMDLLASAAQIAV